MAPKITQTRGFLYLPALNWPGIILSLSLLIPCATQASTDKNYPLQRIQFEQAEHALKRGHLGSYRKLKAKLSNYPLLPYLDYAELKRNLRQHSADEIHAFISQYGDTPLATRLLQNWLRTRARQADWQGLADNYFINNSRTLNCQYARALYETGAAERAHVVTRDLWLSGRSLPRSCDRPIAQWRKAGQLSNELLWQRIQLAMQKGNIRLTRYLGTLLPAEERFWIAIWEKVRRNPDYLLEVSQHFQEKNPDVLRWIAVYGIRRLASRDPLLAAEYWKAIQQQFAFTNTEQGRIERRLVLNLVRNDTDTARKWLSDMKVSQFSDEVLSAYVLTSIRDQDWQSALDWLNRMEPELQHSERWRYWRGRVLESMGRLEEARDVYLLNAEARSYYSFLAADRIGSRYRFSHRPLIFTAMQLDDVRNLPGILRAQELYALKRVPDQRREWNYAIKRMNKAQLLKAAKLAGQWGWHDRVITTLAQARYWDDLELRFPLAYEQQILTQAEKQGINPAWAFAVIRQESAFTSDARSHAGAMGLMQLLPRTARRMARTMRVPMRNRYALLNTNTNIKLGVGYLKKVIDRYDGHPVLATAAYNAGGRHVKRWMPEENAIPSDLWIELVPFEETRKYMKRVLTYTVIYEQRLGQPPVPLLERMRPIPATRPQRLSVHPNLSVCTENCS
ncbi:Soluble lytic murein transglycosylase precursor [hydrothermal vent metagenome]|uniref:Soluble lytic murein transglycosylase n=1 Tax=hydrothermal vent metagenome TaxID=652676 RepID=A0A3B1BU06_9ZZZZ